MSAAATRRISTIVTAFTSLLFLLGFGPIQLVACRWLPDQIPGSMAIPIGQGRTKLRADLELVGRLE
jgi:hypothetical protein